MTSNPVECFTWADSHLFGDSLAQHYRLRHHVFVEKLGWSNMTTERGMEWDQYDTPSTHYLIKRDHQGVSGTIRLVPTTGNYMIADIWGDRVIGGARRGPDAWEGSRLATRPGLTLRESRRACAEILAAAVEFGARLGFDRVFHVTSPVVVRGALDRIGLRTRFLSEPWPEAGEEVVISETMTTPDDWAAVSGRLGLGPSNLALSDAAGLIAA
jgi:acyl homoserine lactone synthase